MAAPPPQLLLDPAHLLPDGAAGRFDAVLCRMPLIAEAVAKFTDPVLRERAYYELVSIINPAEPEPEPVDGVEAVRDVGRLENWLHVNLPDEAARIDGTLNNTAVDVAIGLLREFRQSLLTRQEKIDDREQVQR